MVNIAFIITVPILSGGTYVIFEHAIRINRRGKKRVFIVMEQTLNPDDLFWHPEAKELEWLTFEEAQNIQFDAIIATWWFTCYEACRLRSRSYLYFNQSVESKFYPSENIAEKKTADATYFLGLNVITEATWIQEYLKTAYNIDAQLVLNGVRKDIYTPDGPAEQPREKGKLRVLIEGHLEPLFKNTRKTIELCRQSEADEIWLLTGSDVNEYPGIDRIFSRLSIFKTPEIYRSCDVLVKLSYIEGMFGPPLEMFHCGGTAIVYDVTGHDEYIKHNYNALVVQTDDENQVIASINALKDSPNLLQTLKTGAQKTAISWNDWDTASERFETAIEHGMQIPSCDREELMAKTQFFRDWLEKALEQEKKIRKQHWQINHLLQTREYRLGRRILSPLRKIQRKLSS